MRKILLRSMPLLILLIKAFSRLPWSWLYALSNLVRFVLLNVVGYRVKVVRDNLRNAFPELTNQEVEKLVEDYYGYLADQMVETIKLWSISRDELSDRVVFANPELLQRFESNGRNVIIMMGHSGNWEWAGCATELKFQFRMLPVYRRIKNGSVNGFYYKLRSRFGSTPVLDKEAVKDIQDQAPPHAVAMLADQRPRKDNGWWVRFLNQDTPFFRGSEVLAKRLDYDVVFAHVNRAGRGRYSIQLENAPEQWQSEKHLLTRSFVRFLEQQIAMDKANWLWSHKRWKFKADENSKWI